MKNQSLSRRRIGILSLLWCLVAGVAVAQPTGNKNDDGPINTEEEYQKRYNERITKDRLYGVYIPKNLDDAMLQLDKQISEESKKSIRSIPEDSACMVLHRRLGLWMINNWGFYEGSRLSHYLRSAGVSYPDDMADFLILAYHRHLNQKPIELKELAKFYRETRKKEHLDDLKKGEVISEEVRKRPKPEAAEKPAAPPAAGTKPTPANPPKKPTTTPKTGQ
jgi:hypothetical protein